MEASGIFKRKHTESAPPAGPGFAKYSYAEIADDPRASVVGKPWTEGRSVSSTMFLYPAPGGGTPRITSSAVATPPGAEQTLLMAPSLFALQFVDRASDRDMALQAIRARVDEARADPSVLTEVPLFGDRPADGAPAQKFHLWGLLNAEEVPGRPGGSMTALLECEPDMSDDADLWWWQLETGFTFYLAFGMMTTPDEHPIEAAADLVELWLSWHCPWFEWTA